MTVVSTDTCACGRMDKPIEMWLCRACFLEKEIRYALSELDRPGGPWDGESWADMARWRLRRLVEA